MTIAEWPSTLPLLNVDGYAEQDTSGIIRTPMDAGPDFVRRRFTAVQTQIANNLVLTNTEYNTLLSFYRATLFGGVAPFEWTHPRTEATVEMRFLNQPAGSAAGGDLFDVRIELEILP